MKANVFLTIIAAGIAAGCSGGGGPQGGFAVQVVVEKAKQQPINETIPLVGTLAANESVELKSEVDGKVERINFREGQRVKAGHVLFVIEGAKLAAQVGQAEAQFNLSQANLKRSEALVQNQTISKQEYDQAVSRYQSDKATLELVRQELSDATIRAPFSGTIGARLVSPGQVVAKGTKLSTLIDSNPMKVEFTVPERYAGKLKKGLKVGVKVAPHPGQEFQGRVYFVSPEVDSQTRTVLVKARIPNKKGKLSPGFFANLDLRLGVIEKAVIVPESALMKQADQVQLYVVSNEKSAELRTVQTGIRLEGLVQIVEGVAPGELVISEGNQKVRPGAPVSYEMDPSMETGVEESPARVKTSTPTSVQTDIRKSTQSPVKPQS